MKFIYRGAFSNGTETQIAMGMIFVGREPSGEVRDAAAQNWLLGHPEYELVTDVIEVVEEAVEAPPAPKNARKAKK